MSQQTVEIVRGLQPGPDVDLTELFVVGRDDAEVEATVAAAAPAFTDDFVCIFHALSEEPRFGIDGLRRSWLDWLAPWESYRTESRGSSTREIESSLSVATSDIVLEWNSKCISRAAPRTFVTPGRGAAFFPTDARRALEAAGWSL